MAEIRIERRPRRTLPALLAGAALLLGLLLWSRQRGDHTTASAGAVDAVQTSTGSGAGGPQ